MFEYDKSSKWLIQHHGDRLLRLAGVTDIVSWKACQAEVVLPRQLPDGLLEVQLAGEPEPTLFIVELASYPDNRIATQLIRDLLLVFADRRVMPEVLVVVLHPKGALQVAPRAEWQSARGWTHLAASWRVVELWNLPAAPLLAAEDPGIVPWIPLTHFDQPPEEVFQQCRSIIELRAAPEEKEDLLIVTQILAGIRYNDPKLLHLITRRDHMIASPVLIDILSEQTHKNILCVLTKRLQSVPLSVRNRVEAVRDLDQLNELLKCAAVCADLAEFEAHLPH